MSFSIIIGACLGNAAISAAYPPYADAYKTHGLGGLIREVYHPIGWSKFCLVLLTFSVLGNNIAINYSSGLSLQLLGHYFHAIPRFLWSLLVAVVVAVLAIAGQQNLSQIVSNFVSLLGYWTVSFTVILFLEDQWFRRSEGYNLQVWDQPSKLPLGIAAVVSLLAGYLAGGVVREPKTTGLGVMQRMSMLKFAGWHGPDLVCGTDCEEVRGGRRRRWYLHELRDHRDRLFEWSDVGEEACWTLTAVSSSFVNTGKMLQLLYLECLSNVSVLDSFPFPLFLITLLHLVPVGPHQLIT